MNLKTLKELAKELYYNNVSSEDARKSFDIKVETYTVEDRRDSGWYCGYCRTFHPTPIAFHSTDVVIFPVDKKETIWIANEHYDGCMGWE